MSVTIATSNLPTLSHDFNLSDSRVDRLLNANSLEEAQHMGILDWLIDYIFGGGKREAIAEAYTAITKNEDASVDADTRKLNRFESLKSLALPEHADKFSTSVAIDSASGKWSYTFSIDNTSIFQSEMRDIGSGHALATYQDAILWSNLDMALKGHEDAADIMRDLEPLKAQFAAQNEAASEIAHPTVDLAQKFTQIAKTLVDKGVTVSLDTMQIGTTSETSDESGTTAHMFKLSANNQEVYSGNIEKHPFDVTAGTQDTAGSSGAPSPTFNDLRMTAPLTALTMAQIEVQLHSDLPMLKDMLEDRANFIEARLQTMVDAPEHKSALVAALNDPAYGSTAFSGIKPGQTGSTFIAVFGDRELTLSNRSNNGEFRGAWLKEKLQNSSYATLNDLIGAGHLTEEDSLLIATVSPSRNNFYTRKETLMSSLEREQIHHALHDLKFYDTTLGKLYGVSRPEVLGVTAETQGSFSSKWG